MLNFFKKIFKKKMGQENTKTISVLIYTEQTPNPESLKFVTSKMLFDGIADFSNKEMAQKWSELAVEMYKLPFVKSLVINRNFITVDKYTEYTWRDIMHQIKDFLKAYINEGKPIVGDGYKEMLEEEWKKKRESGELNDINERIIEIIDQQIRPWIEQDGGGIEFVSFEEGRLIVRLYGACSSCSSATITLKAGVEKILKSMIPEIHEVVQDFG